MSSHVFARWLRTLLFGTLLLFLACMILWMNRIWLLREVAQAWVISDSVSSADAVAVLGGGLKTRPFAAASYYHQGIVRKVLISEAPTNTSGKDTVVFSETALNRAVLLKLGVPEAAIEAVGHELSNTFEESVALRGWAVRNHAVKIVVPTEVFSSRRVRWIMQHTFAGTGVRIQVPALASSEYSLEQWWHEERGRGAFENEIIKYIYYRLKYQWFDAGRLMASDKNK